MRASLAHIDEADDQEKKDDEKRNEEYLAENGMAKPQAPESKQKPPLGGYRKRETERAMHARHNSYQHLLQRELAEPFVELDVNARWSDECYAEYEHMFWRKPEDADASAPGAQCPSGFGGAPGAAGSCFATSC